MPGCKNELRWAVAVAALVGTVAVACNGREARSGLAEDDGGVELDLAVRLDAAMAP